MTMSFHDIAPARNPTPGELRLIALLRTVTYGHLEVQVRGGSVDRAQVMHDFLVPTQEPSVAREVAAVSH